VIVVQKKVIVLIANSNLLAFMCDITGFTRLLTLQNDGTRLAKKSVERSLYERVEFIDEAKKENA